MENSGIGVQGGLQPQNVFVPFAPVNLLKKLLAVMEAIDHVEKRGENTKQNYKYVKAADLYHAIRNEFIKNKVFMTSSIVKNDRWDFKTDKSSVLFRTVEFDFMFYDLESGETLGPLRGVGDGVDFGGDKAVYKAQTGALKYIARTMFLLPDDTDPEAEEEAPKRKGKSSQANGEKTQAQPAGEAGVGGSSPPVPSKDQMNKVHERLKKIAGRLDSDQKTGLKEYILRTTGEKDTKAISIEKWIPVLDSLEVMSQNDLVTTIAGKEAA